MNILITGGAGFLGKSVCKRLHKLGHSVSACGRDVKSGTELEQSGIQFFKADIVRENEIFEAAKNQDAIIHCAACAPTLGPYEDFYNTNVLGTANVVAACRQYGIKKLVNLSTPSIYFDYQHRLNIKESDPLPKKAATHYAATKLLAEEIIDDALQQGISSVTLRPRAIIGEGDKAIFPRLLQVGRRGVFPLPGDGQSLIDLTYIDNVVDAVILALDPSPQAVGEKFNITNGEPITVQAMVEKLFGKLHRDIRFKKVPYPLFIAISQALEMRYKFFPGLGKPSITKYGVGMMAKSQTLDISKARKLLGYEPKVSLDTGFQRFADYWLELEAAGE